MGRMKMRDFKLPKWAVVIAAALLFLPLAVDWVAPGEGARIAEHTLREVEVEVEVDNQPCGDSPSQ